MCGDYNWRIDRALPIVDGGWLRVSSGPGRLIATSLQHTTIHIQQFVYDPNVRALGIDYGHRRIGLALSDATGLLARPWKTILREGAAVQVATTLASEIAALAAEDDGLSAVVVGWPRRLNGDPTDQTAAVGAIVDRLRSLVSIPVLTQDERLSSREAESRLAQREKDWRKRKAMIDAAAAAVILQDYLDDQPRPAPVDRESEDQ
jgi:putative Holliday junction resolvase